jgi:release factor glutamine methyltransferase
VLNARLNGILNGVAVDARRGDLFDAVAGERFDLILANPPYVPGSEPPSAGRARAWEAGGDGRAILDRICARVARQLAPGGSVLLVHSELADPARTRAQLRAAGLDTSVVALERGPFGPLVEARRSELEHRGALIPGQAIEEVVVIRGQAGKRGDVARLRGRRAAPLNATPTAGGREQT